MSDIQISVHQTKGIRELCICKHEKHRNLESFIFNASHKTTGCVWVLEPCNPESLFLICISSGFPCLVVRYISTKKINKMAIQNTLLKSTIYFHIFFIKPRFHHNINNHCISKEMFYIVWSICHILFCKSNAKDKPVEMYCILFSFVLIS